MSAAGSTFDPNECAVHNVTMESCRKDKRTGCRPKAVVAPPPLMKCGGCGQMKDMGHREECEPYGYEPPAEPSPSPPPSPLVAPGPASLFKTGNFLLHSGKQSDFKIDCDALTDADWESLAHLVAGRVGKFSSVEGVPRGGLKLAEKLQSHVQSEGPILIVDDVLTTGASLEQQRAGRDAIGAVVFARSQPSSWVTPLFTLTPRR